MASLSPVEITNLIIAATGLVTAIGGVIGVVLNRNKTNAVGHKADSANVKADASNVKADSAVSLATAALNGHGKDDNRTAATDQSNESDSDNAPAST